MLVIGSKFMGRKGCDANSTASSTSIKQIVLWGVIREIKQINNHIMSFWSDSEVKWEG
jgi:hypothetical protein